MADRHLLSPVFCQWGLWRSLSQLLITGACSQQHNCLSWHFSSVCVTSLCEAGAEKSRFSCLDDVAPWPSSLAELMLATPGLLSSSTVWTTVLLATSVVEASAVERCFIRRKLLTTDVDKHFAVGHDEHFTYVLAFHQKEIKVVSVLPLWKRQLSLWTRHCCSLPLLVCVCEAAVCLCGLCVNWTLPPIGLRTLTLP